MKENIVEISKLRKVFAGKLVLNNVNLTVKRNSIYGFLGINGAGKTTTILSLLGMIKPTSGNIKIFGKDIEKDSIEIRRKIGYLAQKPEFYRNFTPKEVLLFSLKFFYDRPENNLLKRVYEVAEIVGLQHKINEKITNFSGGEIQRLGIAQAFVHYPELLILDEPAASLDPVGRHEILNLIKSLQKETAIFYSSHLLEDVKRISDTVGILHNGEIILESSIGDLVRKENVHYFKVRGDVERFSLSLKDSRFISNVNIKEFDQKTAEFKIILQDNLYEKDLITKFFSNPDFKVLQYNSENFDLEDLFINLVKENVKR